MDPIRSALRGRGLWLPSSKREAALGFAMALVLPIVATRFVDGLELFDRFPSLPFLIAVLIAASVGRMTAAITAIAVSTALMAQLEIDPPTTTGLGTFVSMSVFIAVASVVAIQLAKRDAGHEAFAATAERLRQLQAITDATLTGLPFDELAFALLERLRASLGMDGATLLLMNREGTALLERANVGTPHADQASIPVPLGKGIAGTIAASGSSLVVDDMERYEVVRPWLRSSIRTLVGAPLVYDGRVRGVVHLVSSSPRHIRSEEVETLELAAERMAVALERASLRDNQAAMAIALQRSLLPATIPRIDGLEIAASHRPFVRDDEVGGDFYDVLDHGDGTWGAAIGDVAGKGPTAAAIMALVVHSLRAIAHTESRPSRLLAELNEILLSADQVPDDRFCTACLFHLQLDPRGLRATVSSAGHPLPFVVRGDGRVSQVGSVGTLLGTFADPLINETTIELARGDVLVGFTDGVVERRASSIERGHEELATLLAACAGTSAAEIVERIERSLIEDARVEDDAAVIAIRATE